MNLEEAIKHLEEELEIKKDWSCVACKEDHQQLLEWLKELQSIKSVEPSEALKCLESFKNEYVPDYQGNATSMLVWYDKQFTTIKNYILKAQE